MIENTSVLEKKAILALNRTFRKKRKYWLLVALSEFLFLALSILFYFRDPMDSTWIGYLILFSIFPLLVVLILGLKTKILYRSDKIHQSPRTVHFAFGEEDFAVQSKSPTAESSGTLRYSLIYRAYDSPEYLFLLINRLNAYCVAKNGFTSGTVEDLLALLKKNGVIVR